MHGSWNQGKQCVPGKTCVAGQINVYLTDSVRATNEEASIRENELSAGTLTNPRTQVTNQHSFRIRTRGAKGPYLYKETTITAFDRLLIARRLQNTTRHDELKTKAKKTEVKTATTELTN